jgi:hypothetical protein
MIIWINGAFGSGKTVTAAELERRLNDSGIDAYIYDPENIGFFLRKNTPSETGGRYSDFQDDPLWRLFNHEIISDIRRSYNGVLIIPMTIIRPSYYRELIGLLREGGAKVDHYILGADRETLKRRQRSRFDFGASWAAAKLDSCIEAFSDPVFEGFIDTSAMTVEEQAEHIAASSGLRLLPDRAPAPLRFCRRIITQLRHIR